MKSFSKFYLSRCKKNEPKRPSTFLRDHKLVRKVQATCRNAIDKLVTDTYLAFRDQAEFAGQLTKGGGNTDLIDYLSKEVFTKFVLRDRLLKGIADELPMKDNFEKI